MFKKSFILAIALFGMTSLSGSLFAGELYNGFSSTTVAESVEGNYNGSLNYVNMNGSVKDPVPNITAQVTENTDGSFNINIPAFQVGSMPGSITVNATDLDNSGNFNKTCNDAVILTILGIKSKFDAQVSGSIVGSTLNFSIITVGATYLGIPFSAEVHFAGTK
ncbi:MAG: calycin-like domain-containing protein [Prevotella sp.]|jgi:hypothetical protein|nr:calycin-like domain-containing protein [Prevotella sp.]MCH3995590.1 calycin-like domain-containing protein [Prevotella sp.]